MIYSQEDITTIGAALPRLREAVIATRSDGSEPLADKTDSQRQHAVTVITKRLFDFSDAVHDKRA